MNCQESKFISVSDYLTQTRSVPPPPPLQKKLFQNSNKSVSAFGMDSPTTFEQVANYKSQQAPDIDKQNEKQVSKVDQVDLNEIDQVFEIVKQMVQKQRDKFKEAVKLKLQSKKKINRTDSYLDSRQLVQVDYGVLNSFERQLRRLCKFKQQKCGKQRIESTYLQVLRSKSKIL